MGNSEAKELGEVRPRVPALNVSLAVLIDNRRAVGVRVALSGNERFNRVAIGVEIRGIEVAKDEELVLVGDVVEEEVANRISIRAEVVRHYFQNKGSRHL